MTPRVPDTAASAAPASPPRRRLPAAAGLRLLVSVRDPEEALQAAAGGIDLIDLKEPAAGALGALAPALARATMQALRGGGYGQPVSATIGDHEPGWSHRQVRERIEALAAAGVDWVKVGIGPGLERPLDWLDMLAGLPAAVVPVFIVDAGLEPGLWREACRRFPLLMLDTADKLGGSLLERLDPATLAEAVVLAQAQGAGCGLAGALRIEDVPALRRLGCDYAGFRSAVCEGPREGRLAPERLARLRAAAGRA